MKEEWEYWEGLKRFYPGKIKNFSPRINLSLWLKFSRIIIQTCFTHMYELLVIYILGWLRHKKPKTILHFFYEGRGGIVFRSKWNNMKCVNNIVFSQNMYYETTQELIYTVYFAFVVFPIAWKKSFGEKGFCVKRCLVQICNAPGGINPIKHEVLRGIL